MITYNIFVESLSSEFNLRDYVKRKSDGEIGIVRAQGFNTKGIVKGYYNVYFGNSDWDEIKYYKEELEKPTPEEIELYLTSKKYNL